MKKLPSLFVGRFLPAFLLSLNLVTVSQVAGQMPGIPGPGDVSPTLNTDVSTMIMTGGGHDAWSGAARRTVVDFEVPGAVSSHGLKWSRTYSSSRDVVWSFAYTWRYYTKRDAQYPYSRDGHTPPNALAGGVRR